MSNFREMYFEGEIDGKGLLDEIDRLRAEVSMLREYYDLANHKVITCGVAASHPDAGLASRGAYKEKWDSPQAEEVRKLRSEADSLRKAVETKEDFLSAYFKACNTSQPSDWHEAAMRAKQWECRIVEAMGAKA